MKELEKQRHTVPNDQLAKWSINNNLVRLFFSRGKITQFLNYVISIRKKHIPIVFIYAWTIA